MNFIIDVSSITESEKDYLKKKFSNDKFYEKNLNCYLSVISSNDFNGSKYDTILISRNTKNIYIRNEEGKLTYPIFIKVDENIVWGENDKLVDAKVKCVEDIANNNIITLFGEKLAFTNKFDTSCCKTSLMKSKFSYYCESTRQQVELDIYCLGRYIKKVERTDDFNFFCNKLLLKFCGKNNINKFNQLKTFISYCLDYFKTYHNDYDYICYPNCDECDRFEDAVPSNIIEKVKETLPLKMIGKKQNRENEIKGKYKIKNNIDVTGKRILLYDDIVTSGTTIKEISSILYEGGASVVDVLCIGKTIDLLCDKIGYHCPECNGEVKMEFYNKNGDFFLYCPNNNKIHGVLSWNKYSYFFKIYKFVFGQ